VNMPKKTSWIISLVITIVPFFSAIITNFVSPPENKSLYYTITGLALVITWFVSAAIISNTSKRKLRKLGLLPRTDVDDLSGYWKILYGTSNCNKTPCSLLKLAYLDDFESYEAQLTDFSLDNTGNKITLGNTHTCRNVFFDGDKKVVKITFESAITESRQDDFMLEYRNGEQGTLKRITSWCLGENNVKVGFCFGEVSRISEADIESAGIRTHEEVKKAYRRGLIKPKEFIDFLYKCITTEDSYKTLAANVILDQPVSSSDSDAPKNKIKDKKCKT